MDKSTQYKIFTDPVHGFVSVPKGLVLKLLDHPYVQRLRRIRQLGLANTVFPGAEHSRFSHALGALGLMQRVLNHLRERDTTITYNEFESTLAAILLHDIGHGPFSHTLEKSIIGNAHHEKLTLLLMEELNRQFEGQLDTAIRIFTNRYPKVFLHQLISSQLDIDRLDYLRRDSMFTGVLEGSIGIDRIIRTMRVHQGNIVIDKKGIYAIENYIVARRLMYMQVYLHKTVLGGDKLLIAILNHARRLLQRNEPLPFYSPALEFFISQRRNNTEMVSRKMLDMFTRLDDNDIILTLKYWQHHDDPVLSDLCRRFLDRDFFRTTFLDKKPTDKQLKKWKQDTSGVLEKMGMPSDSDTVSSYFFYDFSQSEAYKYKNDGIWILNDDVAVEFSRASDNQHILALTKPVIKHYVVHLKNVPLN
ncbi:HD domain-containing protein [Natronogracilivirga saccharolytica]|uniref:HD domain-containing protein n=1 Tax=Natronogracilivirga saccharolytica TaxID=2812953 RepID=A0A8J7UUI9_9BACT|nr:HD domain-containing protein [Natronogracilivirga saccharolytica]MBP3192470.1 HD domain-containing protein [Natronogracilivirga saccharolytica]